MRTYAPFLPTTRNRLPRRGQANFNYVNCFLQESALATSMCSTAKHGIKRLQRPGARCRVVLSGIMEV
jgi:hypothetical protein